MNFSEYLVTVAVAAFAGVASDMINDAFLKGKEGIKRYIEFGICVCILSCMIIPLFGFFSDVGYGYDKFFASENSDVTIENELYILEKECEELLRTEIYNKNGFEPTGIEIKMKKYENIPRIERAYIVIENRYSDQKEAVSQTALEELGTKAEVVTEEENERTV